MRFAKVIDGALKFAPRKIKKEGKILLTNSSEEYAALGYFPVRLTDAPACPEGYELSYYWEDDGTACVQVWKLYEIPKPEETDPADMLAALNILGVSAEEGENNG